MTPIRITALVADPHRAPFFQAQLSDGRWLSLSARRYQVAESGWDRRMDRLL